VAATIVAPAAARSPVPLIQPTGSWASELAALADLVKPADTTCSDHCFLLEKLHLSGALDHGRVDFVLEGQLLEAGSYIVPLFGPASSVRLEDVTENGARAAIGFEDNHYYLHTSAKHFTLRGKLVLPEDRTVTIVGPLDALDSDVTGGRITEGAHLTALTGTQIHFDAEGAAPDAQPPVFSIARALRVGKSIDFEYKLTAQAGKELGVLRFPLRYGERVVDVAGSTGWRIESEELLMPTIGKIADITITGTLANVASFAPDPRASFEWWLLESDAEHRVLASGDAKQHDASESPILRREPNSRLFLLQRGQHLDVSVQTLQSLDVLAATIRSHTRLVVLTASGDLVMQDVLSYDNSGIDYLYYTPDGKPLYLATDGASERVMHKDGTDDLMIPMRLGQHNVVVQSLSQASLGSLFGRIVVPGSRVPLATGSEDITFGMPASIHPLVVTGGEQTSWPLNIGDGVALALSALAAALALRGWKRRSLGVATMFGLWFVSKPVFVIALAAGVIAILWPLLARMNKTSRRVGLGLAVLASLVIGVPMLVATKGDLPSSAPMVVGSPQEIDRAREVAAAPVVVNGPMQASGGLAKELAHGGGLLDGVRPVALTMPSYAHAAYASRQLVTPARTFTPVIYYVTDTGFALLALAWLACAAGLAWSYKDKLRALRDQMRAALAAPKPIQPIEPAAPAPAE
jgi:hypothetical protein